MSSQSLGKAIVCDWIRENVAKGSTCLDVGACDGVWWNALNEHLNMDAVEVFERNIEVHRLREKYTNVIAADVRGLQYGDYDIIIFGDVLEHMTVEEAQACLKYAEAHSKIIIVALPFMWRQGEIYGNPYERHVQDDLTEANVKERYPELTPIVKFVQYAYYYWRAGE